MFAKDKYVPPAPEEIIMDKKALAEAVKEATFILDAFVQKCNTLTIEERAGIENLGEVLTYGGDIEINKK